MDSNLNGHIKSFERINELLLYPGFGKSITHSIKQSIGLDLSKELAQEREYREKLYSHALRASRIALSLVFDKYAPDESAVSMDVDRIQRRQGVDYYSNRVGWIALSRSSRDPSTTEYVAKLQGATFADYTSTGQVAFVSSFTKLTLGADGGEIVNNQTGYAGIYDEEKQADLVEILDPLVYKTQDRPHFLCDLARNLDHYLLEDTPDIKVSVQKDITD